MATKKKNKKQVKKVKKTVFKRPLSSKKGKQKPLAKKGKTVLKKPVPSKPKILPPKSREKTNIVPSKTKTAPTVTQVQEALPPPPIVMPGTKKPKKSRTSSPPKKKVIVIQPLYPYINKPLQSAAEKEPSGKFTLEYVIRSSPQILYEFIATPSGLAGWFADDVNITKEYFTFIWNGQEQNAFVLGMKEDNYIRFRWAEKNDGSYFEFRIELDDLTGDVSLMITDFADESDRESSRLLWDSQVQKLMKVLGSY